MKRKAVVSFVLIVLFLVSVFHIGTFSLSRAQLLGLVGYWKLDENSGTTAYDSSGYNNNGIINGASWTSGKVASALSFDGVDDYVDCGTGPSLMPTAAITLEAWFKASAVNAYATIASTLYYEGYELIISPYGVIEFFPGISYSPLGTVQPDVWYHVVGTFDGTTSRIYVNGELVGSQGAGYLAYTGQRLSIGTNPTRTGWFNGIIDEVKIYNRALSAQEIWAEYTSNESVPQPQIVEPSILDAEAPRHNDTLVIWGDSINVSAIELRYAEDIENTTFAYSSNGIDWNIIGTSYLGIKEWENWTDIDGDPFNSYRMWTVAWNTNGVREGLYFIRTTMVDTAGQIGQDNITVYFDPTPPIPEFTLPWGAMVNGTVQISAVTNATDILYTQFESLKVSTEYKVKPVMEPNTKSAWNAMAALLNYWASRMSKEIPPPPPPLGYLTKDDAGNVMNADALIKAMIDYYNKKYNPKPPVDRTKDLSYDMINILLAWLFGKKNFDGYVRSADFPSLYMIKWEFEQNGPLILQIQRNGKVHTMVLKSFDNKIRNQQYNVDFADSDATATGGVRDTKMAEVSHWYGCTTEIKMEDGWWEVVRKIQIVPNNIVLKDLDLFANWIPQDIDTTGTKVWYCTLNTTKLKDGYHFISATMVDSSGNEATATTEIFVNNHPADINKDGVVDILDAILLSLSYGKQEGQEDYNPDTNLKTGDATPEEINILDAVLLAIHFNEHYDP